jgi:streptomycin 6-kinase
MLNLPPEFLHFNRSDPVWLNNLPSLIAQLGERWSLQVGPAFPSIRINYVAPARRADGTPAILKISRFVGENLNELAALRLWNGDGAVRLLDADPERGALLIERLEPGTMLTDVSDQDDAAATAIAARLLGRLWRPVPPNSGLRSLARWFDAYDRNREAIRGGSRGFPAPVFERADALLRELLASTDQVAVLHGDFHHFNILRAQREPWLAIDPKGLAGDHHFDVCQFFRNPYGREIPPAVNRRRLAIFCAELGLNQVRARNWCFVHAVLDACWSLEDGEDWRPAVAYARETQSF